METIVSYASVLEALQVITPMYMSVSRALIEQVYDELLPPSDNNGRDGEGDDGEGYRFVHDHEFDVLYAQYSDADDYGAVMITAYPYNNAAALLLDGEPLNYIFTEEHDLAALKVWAEWVAKKCQEAIDNNAEISKAGE